MTLTDQHWRALAARGVPADAIADVTGLSRECVEERLAEAEKTSEECRAVPPPRDMARRGAMMTGVLSRPDLPRHYYCRLG